MFRLVLRKIFNNKWLVLCLLIGSILAVAVVSSIPMYSSGMLQRMLIKDFETTQEETNIHPATYEFISSWTNLNVLEDRINLFEYYDKKIKEDMSKKIPMSILTDYTLLGTSNYLSVDVRGWDLYLEEVAKELMFPSTRLNRINIYGMTNLETNVKVISGRMYNKEPIETTNPLTGKTEFLYEVIVSSEIMKRNNYVLNGEYAIIEAKNDIEYIDRFKIVGVIEMQEDKSSYYTFDSYGLYMDADIFYNNFIKTEEYSLDATSWYYAYNYYELLLTETQNILTQFDDNGKWIVNNYGYMKHRMSFASILQDYMDRASRLSGLLILLVIPVILMISFYVSMIAQLIMEQEKNEIAMLESRGASRKQIFKIYFYESLFIGIISFIIGIITAIFLCRLLGASNGFMEFVNRAHMEINLSWEAIFYGFICSIFFIIMMLFPAIKASKFTIVQYKQGKDIISKKPFWQKLYLDIILLAVSLWALNNYNTFKDSIGLSGDGQIDYLIFFAVTFFILGLSLVIMRIYPFLINLLFKSTKRFMSPPMYAAFTYVGRGGSMKQFIMIFLILALGVGIFNANSARTINENLVDIVKHQFATDVAITLSNWVVDENNEVVVEEGSEVITKNLLKYEKIKSSELVDTATKVASYKALIKKYNTYGGAALGSTIIGITPEDYGKVVWTRDDLLTVHINFYLNLMASHPDGVIVSSFTANELGVNPGDFISIEVPDIDNVIEAPILAVVDNWPGYNPYTGFDFATNRTVTSDDVSFGFVVMHYDLLLSNAGDIDYMIWLKKNEGVLDSEINTFLSGNDITISYGKYADFEVSEQKKDPMVLGMNGMLTLDFIVTMIICGAGFIIFWILSIRQRVLQFGIFRAMGLSKKELILIIFWEQLLISAVAIILGIVIGGISSDVFVPLFELISAQSGRLIEFKVFSFKEDYYRIYIIVAAMIVIGISIIGRFITHIKMDQAVKLGED
ncbi:MAG: FtsX-like permease family protein [Clostridiales bacterium]|nr:FtsX-like permease family protein [Clostridiales bacterium]